MTRKSTQGLMWLGAITVLGAVLRMQGIGDQPPLRDEVLVAFTARNYVDHGLFGPIMAYHPNLRNLLVWLTMSFAGTGAWGVRGASLILGTASVPLLGALVSRLTASRLAGLLAAFFLAIDGVHITFSRQAIQEVHTTFFTLAAIALFVASGAREGLRERLWLLPLSGIFFGLGVASKSHAFFPLLVCLVIAIAAALRRRSVPTLALSAASLTVLPLSVYLLTYLPWFRRGYDLGEWLFMQAALLETMVTHTGNPMDSLLDTRPMLWFLRPFMGYGDFVEVADEMYVTIATGNPMVWLLVLPAVIYLFAKCRSEPGVAMLQALFWFSYLPLALTTRPVWVLSSIAVTPFAFALVGLWLARFVDRGFKTQVALYLTLILVTSLLLYPLAIGDAWNHTYLRPMVERLNPH